MDDAEEQWSLVGSSIDTPNSFKTLETYCASSNKVWALLMFRHSWNVTIARRICKDVVTTAEFDPHD